MIGALSLCAAIVQAQNTYQNKTLANIARCVSLPTIDVSGEPHYVDTGSYNGKKLTVAYNTEKEITHIGYKLFAPQVKKDYPSAVYDFLERYFLDLQCSKDGFYPEERVRDDKFLFREGSINDIKRITPETPYSISMQDYKYYEVAWMDANDDVILDVAFPVNFELLLGMSKAEIEKTMKAQLLSSIGQDHKREVPALKELGNGVFTNTPVSNYFVESLNTAVYYTKSQDGQYTPYYDEQNKWYSASNLFQGLIADSLDYRLYIQQSLYGFDTMTYTITLKQWLDYCKDNQMKVYFAVEEEREDGLKALLIAHSDLLGFNHMISIIIPDNFITKRDVVLKATLNAYIPTQNVKDLYKSYTRANKKIIE